MDQDPISHDHIYRNASTLHLPDSVHHTFSTPIDPVSLTPNPKTGLIYMSESKYYELLDEAVGNSGWHLEPISPYTVHGITISRSYALYIHDTFVSEARGETELPVDMTEISSSSTNLPDDALEEIDSKCAYTALVRCGKDLGIASELWDGKFSKKFLKEQCIRVWEPAKKTYQWKLRN
jgi:hypothetical protein